MVRVAIRADGSPDIGMGHIIRSLSLAKAFRNQGANVHFLSLFMQGIERIEQEGFAAKGFMPVTAPDRTIPACASETDCLAQELKANPVDILVIDSYNVTEEYFLKVKPLVKIVVYIDDMNKFIYPVDILLNGNITGQYMGYKKYTESEIMLLGLRYNLIRDEFLGLADKKINKEINNIMVTTGGSDPYNLSCELVKGIMEIPEFSNVYINVIVGGAFKEKDRLLALSENYDRVVLHENASNIASIMLQADIAVSAGGSTLYELCACGTPTLAFVMADNQEFLVEKMNELGYIKSLGWYTSMIYKIEEVLNGLAQDYELRKRMSVKGRSLVDAKGTGRAASAILDLLKTQGGA